MAAHTETSPAWKTTIIVSASLQNLDVTRILNAQQHRMRFSDAVEPGAFIFPLSALVKIRSHGTEVAGMWRYRLVKQKRCTAFLLVDPQSVPEQFEESGLIERINTFVQVHRNSFLLFYAPFNGIKELEILSAIQHRFFSSNLRILPVRNSSEIVTAMLTIAKATSKPHVDSIRERMSLGRAHIIENSPIWEILRDML